ncbi:polysaccharide lyase family 8 super-sandwich domain-containing protein [Tuanshanicoccus lijuaniae]|uniref:polysaccharide lyase family 8 super-sandwich domain-containing protein n=1 Tax=Aerococcaceae bacterium zg-1292 TaxID=2774330 RepID=UPI00406488C2
MSNYHHQHKKITLYSTVALGLILASSNQDVLANELATPSSTTFDSIQSIASAQDNIRQADNNAETPTDSQVIPTTSSNSETETPTTTENNKPESLTDTNNKPVTSPNSETETPTTTKNNKSESLTDTNNKPETSSNSETETATTTENNKSESLTDTSNKPETSSDTKKEDASNTPTSEASNSQAESNESTTLSTENKQKTDYDQLLNDWNSTIAGNDVYDDSNSYMAAYHKKLEETVDKHIAEYNNAPDRTYLWKEKSDYKISANLTATYRKLEDIAKQVTNPRSKYYNDSAAIALVKNSLEFLYQNAYNEKTYYRQEKGKASVNWWDYEIGVPRAINNTLSLLKSHFTQSEINKYTEPIEHFVPDPTSFRKTSTNPDFPTFKAAVANMTDMGRVKLIAGLLRRDDKTIAETIKAIETAFTFVDKGNGFYQDGSLIDHAVTNQKSPLYNKGVAYNGSYGNVLIDGLSQLIPIIQKTGSPMSEEKMNVVYHWINESFLPLMAHGELMDMTRGRSVSRANAESHVAAVEVLRAILRIADMSNEPHKTAIKSKVKTIVSEGQSYYDTFKNLKTYRDIQLMKELLEDPNIPILKKQSYIKSYNSMDKLAAYNAQKKYGIGLSMFSDKTQNFEAMNNENLRGWHTSDGMFYLYNADLSHYSNNYWATVNPYKLPGTTETNAKRPDGTAKNIKEQPKLVGMGALPDGAFVRSEKIDDTTAMAAMTFTNFNKTLTLNKGWFVLNGKVVFVGNNIQNTSNDEASTTIEQRKEDPTHPYKTYVNGKETSLTDKPQDFASTKSVFLESNDVNRNIGYVFFKPTTLSLMKAIQSGKWSDINGNDKSANASKIVNNTFVTMSQVHKENGDSYAYMIVPNISRQAFEALLAKLDVQLLQNDKNASSIYDAASGRRLTIDYSKKTFTAQQVTQTEPNDKDAEKAEKAKALATAEAAVKDAEVAAKAGQDKKIEIEKDNLISPAELADIDNLNKVTIKTKAVATSLVDKLPNGPEKVALKARLDKVTIVTLEVTKVQPDNDNKPSVPEQPEKPNVPEQPEKPNVPEQPEKPNVPEQPEKPSEPKTPEIPKEDKENQVPAKPAAPSQPAPEQSTQNDGNIQKSSVLPNTGELSVIFPWSAAALSILVGLGLVITERKKEDEEA